MCFIIYIYFHVVQLRDTSGPEEERLLFPDFQNATERVSLAQMEELFWLLEVGPVVVLILPTTRVQLI